MTTENNSLPHSITSTYGCEKRITDIMSMFFKDPQLIINALKTTNSFIAGSAPLYAIKPWNEDNFDGDIDIWSLTGYSTRFNPAQVESSSPTGPVNMDLVRLNNITNNYWEELLYKQGYIPKSTSAEFVYPNQPSMSTVITKVDHFVHPTTKRRVQLIMCKTRTMRSVLNIFDYTFCSIAWDGKQFRTDYLEDILSGKGKLMNTDKLLRGREEKYAARGFTITK